MAWPTGNQDGRFRHMLIVSIVGGLSTKRKEKPMAYYNHLGFNQPDYYDDDETATVSIRKCNPEIASYLKAQYGDGLPPDVEFWEKLPTASDGRYWIDALSEQAMKEDSDEFGYGDPSVGQYYITDKDITEVIRELGKLIDAKKQEISERGNGRMAGTRQGLQDVAYLTGQMDGLRNAIKLLQGNQEFTVGESSLDMYRRPLSVFTRYPGQPMRKVQ